MCVICFHVFEILLVPLCIRFDYLKTIKFEKDRYIYNCCDFKFINFVNMTYNMYYFYILHYILYCILYTYYIILYIVLYDFLNFTITVSSFVVINNWKYLILDIIFEH